ncbi:efflux RND transporter periplasmic adaptor subunit [Pontibacter qinzhouensis]|uniref:Efflux RND transporter periplasmic adaptor subunit n=1 Tax=Pontibacter qinzhouensis TaxID=2603253 RepID=A0A5C8KAU9_9BACT|nr:efflux RND transporter periplasmic adaptor subunit [Pontibacter qinzhouensis]TXK46812.1 efflux RND transporter periplasmic adaptor subunit [Pontibacter qinzhouensis]
MNKPVKLVLLLVAIAAVSYLLVTKVFSDNGEAKKDGPAGGPMAKLVTVDLFVVSPLAFQNKITSTGTVLPNEEVELTSEIAGRVTGINFNEGTRVKKGQLLLTVNVQELQAQLTKLKSNQKLFRDMEERQRTLLEKEYISRQEYDQVSNQLATATADIQALQATLDKAYLRAPFDGIVGMRQISEGSYVSANTPIARVVDISPVKIEFAVPGRYSQLLKEGDQIIFTSEGSAERYEAKIYALAPSIDAATRTLLVRALYDNKQEEVRPGAFVKVEISLKDVDEAILLPTEAIIPEATGHKVFLAKSGKAVPKMVKIGQRSETLIQIIEGIEPGDTIVRSGILQVRPGSTLKVRNISASTDK